VLIRLVSCESKASIRGVEFILVLTTRSINEFFSLKKELVSPPRTNPQQQYYPPPSLTHHQKDGIPLNLLPITMQANNLDLASATTEVVTNLNHHVQNFDRSASGLRQVAVLQ